MNLNFSGLQNFVWWVGVIEDRVDPLGLGRCRIRIFGHHTDDTTLLPTRDLPWAHPVHPMNSSRTIQSPPLGEWVLGFFMDGKAAQFPVILGVLPGLKKE